MCYCDPSIRTPYCKSFKCQEQLESTRAINSSFKREFRYLVMKFKDVNKYLTDTEKEMLLLLAKKIAKGRADDIKMPLECVVVEHDWPEYEKIWEDIEYRMDISN